MSILEKKQEPWNLSINCGMLGKKDWGIGTSSFNLTKETTARQCFSGSFSLSSRNSFSPMCLIALVLRTRKTGLANRELCTSFSIPQATILSIRRNMIFLWKGERGKGFWDNWVTLGLRSNLGQLLMLRNVFDKLMILEYLSYSPE